MRRYLFITLSLLLSLSGCDSQHPAHVVDNPPVRVQVIGGSVTVNGTINATIPNPMPVTGAVNATVNGSVTVSNFPSVQTVNGSIAATITNPTNPVVIQGLTENGSPMSVRVDNVSMGLLTIDPAHDALHDSQFFGWTYVNQNVVGNGNVSVLFITPNTSVHFGFELITDTAASVRIYEGATVSNNGTAQTAFNHNRASNITAASKVFLTPTISSNGTQIYVNQWGTGKTVGGTGQPAAEYMLAPNTKYLIVLNNETAGAMVASFDLYWYIHTM